MGNRNRSNVLLVEILIVVLFFMLSATVLVQVFSTARSLTLRAGVENRALAEAQNVAEALCAADDPDALLDEMDFSLSHGVWTRDGGEYGLYVTMSVEPAGAGELWRAEVWAYRLSRDAEDGRPASETLFSLPCARYKEAQT